MELFCFPFRLIAHTNYKKDSLWSTEATQSANSRCPDEEQPWKDMTIYDLPGIIQQAWPRASVPSNITSGFAVTGINITSGFAVTGIDPFNRNIFSDEDFAPSYVTDWSNPEVQFN